ncbi:Protein of unknown function [Actinopolyspora xinjiangensis]|uniref:DUF3558 domain-containing protein n=1 Tax=Actinopolyspora xinjiangensis TaxID=405564 RepID=A0A1H0VQY9_9ACTN|nr:DUF3558 family protein [Actinopolyspora xinjiangensis]SDP80595.1 Protein of unknown function [Actinopolyspora xinjiangensis]
MTGRVVRFLAAVLVPLGVSTACGSSDRPRELSLEDVRPCDLISRAELRDLRVESPPRPVSVVEGSDEEGTSCRYSPVYGGTVSLAVVTNHGIDRWTNGSMASSRAVELPRVQGYRAIRLEYGESESGPHDSCTSYVDVASDQSLKVHVSENSADDPPTCETARRFAGNAVRTLSE